MNSGPRVGILTLRMISRGTNYQWQWHDRIDNQLFLNIKTSGGYLKLFMQFSKLPKYKEVYNVLNTIINSDFLSEIQVTSPTFFK
jgi:hypothetical protein